MSDGEGIGALPAGWVELPLGALLSSLESGKRPRGGVRGISEGVPSLGGEHLTYAGGFDFSSLRYVPPEFARSMRRGQIRPGDVLIVKDGATTGKTVLVDDDFPFEGAVANEHLFVCRPKEGVSPRFLATFLRSPEGQRQILAHFQGSAQGGINRTFAEGTMAPVPPPAEQRRVAERLAQVERGRAAVEGRLAAAGSALERLRGAVLAAACSGRLTEDWREPDADPVDDLPAGWDVVSLDLLIERIEAGKSVRAEGRPAEPEEWGVIKVSAMSWGEFREGENKAVVDPALIDPRYEVRPGDLLISRANTVDLVGATVLVGATRPRLLLSDKSLRLIPREGVERAWLNLALRSPRSRAQLSERATGTSESMRNLSQPKILATTITLPPPDEQAEIVRRVDAILTLADRLATQVEGAEERLDRIHRASLAKAFRGELVPTEAALAAEQGRELESAEELLMMD